MKLRDCVAMAAFIANLDEEYEALSDYIAAARAAEGLAPFDPIEDVEIEDEELDDYELELEEEEIIPLGGESEESEDEGQSSGQSGQSGGLGGLAWDFGEAEKGIRFLVACGNRVISEIADAYLPLRKKQRLDTDGEGNISYSDFAVVPAYILSVKKEGRTLPFREYPDRIEVSQRGVVTVEYAYLPPLLSLDDEIPFREGRPDQRIVAYGIACEYFLINGQNDEAVVWDKRYRDGLNNAKLLRHEARIKGRIWR